ncbi:hypothetical protein Y1Q_0019482 [Alligator mississippiensis]|uniref:Uncharacterized protein n=1 Tax=Alligator mississippiensis TaxID=8496 RepID=A0A151NMK4_ALLMI|nr:hypothetical protein Y1Q_0019482 [Alligator mississippiensis]
MLAEGPKPTTKPKREVLLGESPAKETQDRERYPTMEEDDIGPELEPGQFTVDQTHEDGFCNVHERRPAKIEDEVVQPDLAQMVPHFEVKHGFLYPINKGQELGTEIAWLLVPKRYR